jgi:DNA-binding transcriptional LysR family regulator
VAKEVRIRMLGAVPLAIGGLVRPIAIIHRKGKRLPPAVDRFIDVLRKAGDAEAPGGSPGRSGRAERP